MLSKPVRCFSAFLILAFTLVSCSVQKKLARSANENIINAPALINAHVGISVYEPATGKYWFNFQGDKYFVPASNTKIPTCYAAMKYLGDSLVGMIVKEYENAVELLPAGDPTLLHPDYKLQPVLSFLKKLNKPLTGNASSWKDDGYGKGWSWGDYNEYYMAERSGLPIYGNMVTITGKQGQVNSFPKGIGENIFLPANTDGADFVDDVTRDFRSNTFNIRLNGKENRELSVPFITSANLAFKLLGDTIQKNITVLGEIPTGKSSTQTYMIHSQPTDSVLSPMMHRSDNFFAEQSLLMVSNQLLGFMNDGSIIDTLLKTDFKDLPQKPRWVDGSGLSRYNLFTPQDFVAIFDKMMKEFGMERIKNILPTGGTGTISSYYKTEQGYIFVKTGTLSGVVALSGFLLTKKNKQLIFSILVNNHTSSATDVRKAVEKFIKGIRNKY